MTIVIALGILLATAWYANRPARRNVLWLTSSAEPVRNGRFPGRLD
jgi:hypothetical protein